MTDRPDTPNATHRWRAVIRALEAIVEKGCDEVQSAAEIDATEVDEVQRLIALRIATTRRSSLPEAWTRRAGIVMPPTPDSEPALDINGQAPDRPPWSRPVLRERY
jgi:hypothetical protein